MVLVGQQNQPEQKQNEDGIMKRIVIVATTLGAMITVNTALAASKPSQVSTYKPAPVAVKPAPPAPKPAPIVQKTFPGVPSLPPGANKPNNSPLPLIPGDLKGTQYKAPVLKPGTVIHDTRSAQVVIGSNGMAKMYVKPTPKIEIKQPPKQDPPKLVKGSSSQLPGPKEMFWNMIGGLAKAGSQMEKTKKK
jgi:hypothetical protein